MFSGVSFLTFLMVLNNSAVRYGGSWAGTPPTQGEEFALLGKWVTMEFTARSPLKQSQGVVNSVELLHGGDSWLVVISIADNLVPLL